MYLLFFFFSLMHNESMPVSAVHISGHYLCALCLFGYVPIKHVMPVQENTKRDFAYCIGCVTQDCHYPILPMYFQLEEAWGERSKRFKSYESCSSRFLLQLYSDIWKTWCYFTPAGHKPHLLISPWLFFKRLALFMLWKGYYPYATSKSVSLIGRSATCLTINARSMFCI